jgi:hypothetical protein
MGARLTLGRAIAGGLLAAVLSGSVGCSVGCPTALGFGRLTASGDDLVLADATGATHRVVWPDGYSVRRDGVALVLVDRFGTVKAREGQDVQFGGGIMSDGLAHACGDVTVRSAASG